MNTKATDEDDQGFGDKYLTRLPVFDIIFQLIQHTGFAKYAGSIAVCDIVREGNVDFSAGNDHHIRPQPDGVGRRQIN